MRHDASGGQGASVSGRFVPLDEVRNAGHDNPLAKQQAALQTQGRLVVKELVVPLCNDKFRDNDRDRVVRPAGVELLDLLLNRLYELAVR